MKILLLSLTNRNKSLQVRCIWKVSNIVLMLCQIRSCSRKQIDRTSRRFLTRSATEGNIFILDLCKAKDSVPLVVSGNDTDSAEENVARPVYPFTAIIGQEEMKFAAIMNIIDPNIGGIMVMGDRGTGKSTTVRSLVDLLPYIDIVKDDPFMSSPTDPNLMSPDVLSDFRAGNELEIKKVPINMVDLPLGATEDRVCGTIDIEKALTEGTKAFEPGLLAKANRGILYVDEVNLLDDHLVDVLLDSAASGWNTVEREGISICHPARFILIGSGNPEEGELRPQLLDRFGMHAQIKTVKLPEERVRVVEERTEFDTEPKAFRAKYKEQQEDIISKITLARSLLPEVEVPMEIRLKISQVCSELDVDGLRGDLVRLVLLVLLLLIAAQKLSPMRTYTQLLPSVFAIACAKIRWLQLTKVVVF